MRILIVRHGESTGNLNKIFQGQGSYPLTEKGKIQAVLVAKELKDKYNSIDCIYSSDLVRAKESAEIIANILGITEVTFVKGFREHNCGILQDKVFSDELIEKYLKPSMEEHSLKIPDGESRNEMVARISTAFDQIVSKTKEKSTILIITHGGVLGRLFKEILNLLPPEKNFENCKINLLERKSKNDDWKLVIYNGQEYNS
jgi:broad specificity phosphatase PhoE